jgi:predicted MFS family arabinose efflux permease
VSLVAAPALVGSIGLSGLFSVTGALALAGIAVITWWTPPAPPPAKGAPRGRLADVLRHGPLLRLDVGVFVLHAVQLAMWVAIPAMLVQAGLGADGHWQVYLPAVLASFLVMGFTLFPLERRGYLRAVFLGSVALVGVVQLGLLWVAAAPSLWALAALLFLFFCAFNVLEASQPSMASRVAPAHLRGTALGVYNTLQSLGFFAGGAVGGWMAQNVGVQGLFATCAALMGVWLVVAWPMRAPGVAKTAEEVLADEAQAT